MEINRGLDEIFGVTTPDQMDVIKAEKFFKYLDRAIGGAVKDLRWSEDQEAKDAVENIQGEFSWAEDYFYQLLAVYQQTADALDYYRNEVESRLDEDERYELNTILVRNRLEKVNGQTR